MTEPADTSAATPSETTGDGNAYSPSDPYGVKGEWIRHDILALAPASPRRVLSIGCGTGSTESVLQQQGAEVWGIDVSADAVARARQRIHVAEVADIESDPLEQLETGSFDLVLCGDVLEHLRFSEHVLERIHGWLAPGGHLIVAIPNAAHYSVLRTLALQRDWKYESGGLFDRGHYRMFTRKSLLRLLGQHGFAIDTVHGARVLSKKVRLLHIVLRPLFWLLPFLDDYLVYTWTVRARKA